MNMRSVNPLVFVGLLGLLTVGSQLFVQVYIAFYGPRDHHWTHMEMRLPLEETRERFQVFIAGERLERRLARGTLYARDGDGEVFRVVAADVTARVNHWPEKKARTLAIALLPAAMTGAALALLATGLVQTLRRRARPERPPGDRAR